jgi:hypothetical protein
VDPLAALLLGHVGSAMLPRRALPLDPRLLNRAPDITVTAHWKTPKRFLIWRIATCDDTSDAGGRRQRPLFGGNG